MSGRKGAGEKSKKSQTEKKKVRSEWQRIRSGRKDYDQYKKRIRIKNWRGERHDNQEGTICK
jgi:hypothetical protein